MAVRLSLWRWVWICAQWLLFAAVVGGLIAYYVTSSNARHRAWEMYGGCEPSRQNDADVQCQGGDDR